MNVLTKFNSFSSVNGFYKQVDGLSMGSRLSPLISNLYCNMMEQKVISKFIRNNTIISYLRYVDDVFVCCKKGSSEKMLSHMNNYDNEYLEFTVEKMSENKLVFLDTELFFDDNNIFKFRKYRKPTANDHLMDFYCSITPKKYKISTLKSEIHRCHHTNTTKFELEIALQNLKNNFYVTTIRER